MKVELQDNNTVFMSENDVEYCNFLRYLAFYVEMLQEIFACPDCEIRNLIQECHRIAEKHGFPKEVVEPEEHSERCWRNRDAILMRARKHLGLKCNISVLGPPSRPPL